MANRHKRIVSLFLLVCLLALGGPAATAGEGKAVDINTAGVTELTTVTGIGPATAQRIVDYRDANGPFKRVDDLVAVRGIGDKSLIKLRDSLTASAPKKEAKAKPGS